MSKIVCIRQDLGIYRIPKPIVLQIINDNTNFKLMSRSLRGTL